MSLAKLTSISTQTLSLLLERQRLETLPSFNSSKATENTLHVAQITQNLDQLREGILAIEAREGKSEAAGLLRNQYERMRAMVVGVVEVEPLHAPLKESTFKAAPPPPFSLPARDVGVGEPIYSPYTDDPESARDADDTGTMLQTQRHLMNEQDDHLDRLSHSINRQHHISLQINEELDVHSGLLQELDTDLYRTETRLSGARRRLEKVAKGAKEYGSTAVIAGLILVLLILIIVYKT